MTETIFRARSLTRTYLTGEVAVHALRDVSLDIQAGELLVMLGPSGSGKSTSEGENYRVVDDLAVYLGPAAIMRGHPKEHRETSMHDGATSGAHQYHIVVAIFDALSGARIENAGVTATVSGLGHVGTKTIELQPMAIAETVTYGNFVTLLGTDRYDIQLRISVPGREHPVRVGFAYQHTRCGTGNRLTC